MSDDLHSAIMNLQIPMDPKIPSDAGVMLAYKLGHRDARHAAAELALSTPPAAMPAAPSDAVTEILALVRSYGDARQDGNDNRAAGWIRDITAALHASQAEPAAGEQAGAVAKLRHVYANLVNGGVRDTASAKRIAVGLLSPAIEVLERLTPPGAAIAAREQCVTCGASEPFTGSCGTSDSDTGALCKRAPPKEAPATPQADASDEVTEEMLAAGAKFSSQPRATYKAMRAALTQPTAVQQEPDPLLIDSMCLRWRHDFGLQRDADDQLSSGLTDAERDSLRSSMRQLWEEVVGRGFYRPAALKGMQPGERKEET